MNKMQRDRLLLAIARGLEQVLRHVPASSDTRRLALRAALKFAEAPAPVAKRKRLITLPSDPNRVH